MRHGFAKYLIRIDDICPTMNWRVWNRVEQLLLRYDVQPILAVVPDNQDPRLRVDPADCSFWERVRQWQARGWTISLHGYQHQVLVPGSEIADAGYTEFAGLPPDEQETKIRRSLEIFSRENVTPELWIAPLHSFDTRTLSVLCRLGLRVVCDGFFLWPHTDDHGVFRVPQQLWSFKRRPAGVWTVCLHLNAWGTDEIAKFERDLAKYHHAIVSFIAVRNQYAHRQKGLLDRVFPEVYRRAAILKNAHGGTLEGRRTLFGPVASGGKRW